MDRSAVQSWLDRYVAAWLSYDGAAIGDLFSADATYRYHPYDEGDGVLRGREAIVRGWLDPAGGASTRDAEGTYEAQYDPFAVDGNRAVAVGWSRYWTDASRSTERALYHNAYLLEFDDNGRCASFTEFYVQRPAATA